MIKVASLYKFTNLSSLEELRVKLSNICAKLKGTLLLAKEGINGTISGEEADLELVIKQIQELPEFRDLWHQYSTAPKHPFYRFKINIKSEIVTLGKEADPANNTGDYIQANKWNEALARAKIVIDVRNEYEYKIGSFEGALNPHTDSFSEFPEFVKEKLSEYKEEEVAMFCTGGIRCEKASAYMKEQGFKKISQLHGGVLQYLAQVDPLESKWNGECFVFDQRVALKHGLEQGEHVLCYGCQMPLSIQERQEHYREGIHCQYCYQDSPEKFINREQRQKQIALAKARGEEHLGAKIIK